jgi:hypothetical protein
LLGPGGVRKQDVVGRNVAVVHALAVQGLDRAKQRVDQAAQPGFVGRCAHLAAHLAKRSPLQVRHHHIGGGVVFPEAVHLDERGVVELGEQARLVDEGAQADRIGFAERPRTHRDLRARAARREGGRHVLLERDFALQRMIHRQVDDAEPAHTQHAQDLELAETRAHGQRVVLGHRRASAVRTGRSGRD